MDMAAVMVVVSAIAGFAAWHAFIYASSDRRAWSPLWMAFNSTAAAGLFLLAGSFGYNLSGHDRFLAHTAWTGQVIWWQIAVGLAAAVAAAFFWRVGLRNPPPRRPSRA